MKYGWISGAVVVASMLTGGCGTANENVSVRLKRASPRHDELRLVHVPWTPPKATLDSQYVATAADLLGNGLGDPRGGLFSKISIALGDATWLPEANMEAYGWVAADGKHATLLDGVEYPIGHRGTPIDLDTTIRQLEQAPRWGPRPILVDRLNAAVPALLLRVGRSDLAKSVYADVFRGTREMPAFMLLAELGERYQMQTGTYLLKRDDQRALAWSRGLVAVSEVQRKENLKPKYPQFLDQWVESPTFAQILSDGIQWRIDRSNSQPANITAALKLDTPKRIAALADNLDTVSGTQIGLLNGVDYGNDGTFKALVEQGPAAVPALLDAIEKDGRYSRTVSLGEGGGVQRTIRSVRQVAWDALIQIWPPCVRFAAEVDRSGKMAGIRSAWKKVEGLTEPERRLAVLQDDQAGASLWLQSAEYLVKPYRDEKHWVLGDKSRHPNGPMAGDPLRAAHEAEVSTLMANRALRALASDPGVALRIGHCLAQWDLQAAKAPLAEICARTVVRFNRTNTAVWGAMGGTFGIAVEDLAKAGGETAAADYARFLAASPPKAVFSDMDILRPLAALPSDKAFQAAGDRYLVGWSEDVASSDAGQAVERVREATMATGSFPILVSTGFRKLLIRALQNPIVVGQFDTIHAGTSWMARYKLKDGGVGALGMDPKQGPDGAPVTSHPFTLGDLVAQDLTTQQFQGAPQYQLFWSDAHRAEARKAWIAWLSDPRIDWPSVAKSSVFIRAN